MYFQGLLEQARQRIHIQARSELFPNPLLKSRKLFINEFLAGKYCQQKIDISHEMRICLWGIEAKCILSSCWDFKSVMDYLDQINKYIYNHKEKAVEMIFTNPIMDFLFLTIKDVGVSANFKPKEKSDVKKKCIDILFYYCRSPQFQIKNAYLNNIIRVCGDEFQRKSALSLRQIVCIFSYLFEVETAMRNPEHKLHRTVYQVLHRFNFTQLRNLQVQTYMAFLLQKYVMDFHKFEQTFDEEWIQAIINYMVNVLSVFEHLEDGRAAIEIPISVIHSIVTKYKVKSYLSVPFEKIVDALLDKKFKIDKSYIEDGLEILDYMVAIKNNHVEKRLFDCDKFKLCMMQNLNVHVDRVMDILCSAFEYKDGIERMSDLVLFCLKTIPKQRSECKFRLVAHYLGHRGTRIYTKSDKKLLKAVAENTIVKKGQENECKRFWRVIKDIGYTGPITQGVVTETA